MSLTTFRSRWKLSNGFTPTIRLGISNISPASIGGHGNNFLVTRSDIAVAEACEPPGPCWRGVEPISSCGQSLRSTLSLQILGVAQDCHAVIKPGLIHLMPILSNQHSALSVIERTFFETIIETFLVIFPVRSFLL